jgi:hypothetical protein
MAFGFPASYTEIISTVGSRNDTRAAIIGVFEALSWSFKLAGPDLYEVQMPTSASSGGETLTVSLTDEGTVVVASKCRFFQVYDWGQNKRNVNEFAARFSPREIREALLGQNEPAYLSESGQTPVERMISTNELESVRKEQETETGN